MNVLDLANDKPVSVSPLTEGGDHSSWPGITTWLEQPTRELKRSGQLLLPYLVLLHVGFSLPERLLPPRCALTAPFHPYPRRSTGGIFSVALSVEPALKRIPPAVSRHAALWRPDFPLRTKRSGRLSARSGTDYRTSADVLPFPSYRTGCGSLAQLRPTPSLIDMSRVLVPKYGLASRYHQKVVLSSARAGSTAQRRGPVMVSGGAERS